MQNRKNILSIMFVLLSLLIGGCAGNRTMVAAQTSQMQPSLTTIHEIDSFNPQVACRQALEVINSNPYEQELFAKAFGQVVVQCQNSKSPENADIIWDNLVSPIKQSGKVPPDLAKTTWNYYFSRQFVSLPSMGPVSNYCHRLAEIKKNLEKEYDLKKAGFEISQQGSPEAHFLNAMYVYNTMWAACNGND